MNVAMTKKEVGSRYYRALLNVKESAPYYEMARRVIYLLYTYDKSDIRGSKSSEDFCKYNAIVDMLEEYVKIERHKRLLSRKSKWVVTEFNIPEDICNKLGKIQRKLIEEEQARHNQRMRDEELRDQERKAKINESIDKLL